MSKLTIISDKDMEKLLHKLGFNLIRQKGRHKFYEHPDGRFTGVPFHNEDLKKGLIKSILCDIGISSEEYEKLR